MGLNILSLLWDTIRSARTHEYAAIRAARRRHSVSVFWDDRSGFSSTKFTAMSRWVASHHDHVSRCQYVYLRAPCFEELFVALVLSWTMVPAKTQEYAAIKAAHRKHSVSVSETIASTIPWNGIRGYSAAGPITFIFIYMALLTNLFVSFHYALSASPLRHWPNAHLWRPKK